MIPAELPQPRGAGEAEQELLELGAPGTSSPSGLFPFSQPFLWTPQCCPRLQSSPADSRSPLIPREIKPEICRSRLLMHT